MSFRSYLLATALVTTLTFPAFAETATSNSYVQTRFVANKPAYNAPKIEDNFINAWGIVIRPAGKGGHFWVAAKDVSYEYVGDVAHSPEPKLRALHTDALRYVKLPVGGSDNVATGIVFSDSRDHFVITQKIDGAEPITAPAKFLFASDGGIISAWTERKKADGTFDRAGEALTVIDQSKEGAQFFGLAMNSANNRLYVADFGKQPAVKVFDGQFKPESVTFDMPFDDNKNAKVDPGEYAPFNVQALRTPAGDNHIFVTYAKTQPCPAEEIKKGTCKAGALWVGEEDTAAAGQGRLAEFTEYGKLVAVWNDGKKLSAPWGVVIAPANFGALSGRLLVGNFGDGTIAAYDSTTRNFVDVVRDTKGQPVTIDRIWGMLFGNGESLGDKNALYFTAGPNDEKDGLFGSLRPAVEKSSK
jgi:uncharacterized protein (TIGR03118 family)